MSDQNKTSGTHIGGNVSGQNVVIDSIQTITGNQIITVGAIPAATEDIREKLKAEIAELTAALEKLPAEQVTQVKIVELAAKDAVAEAEKPKPDRQLLQIRGESLKQAALNLLAVAPIAAKIAQTLLHIG